MGAWGERMQASDDALDAVDHFRRYDTKQEGFKLNKLGQSIVDGKRSLKAALSILDSDVKVLGVAEFFLEHGVSLRESRALIQKAIRKELSKTCLLNWVKPSARKAALLRFKSRLMGKKVNQKLLDGDNEGLMSRMSRGGN